MDTHLVRVEAPHFVAGLIFNEAWVCVEAAPILRWAEGQDGWTLRRYFDRKGWRSEAC